MGRSFRSIHSIHLSHARTHINAPTPHILFGTLPSQMFRSFAVSALLALGSTQLPQGVDAAAALVSSISDNDTTTTYTSLDPQKYAIDLSYIINGKTTNPVPCDNDSPDAACMTTLQADVDSVIVNYAPKPEYQVNSTSTVRLQLCYSTPSTNDRPWRKYNDVISKNKQCPLDIATNLSPEGEYTYFLPNYTLQATYFMQVVEICEDGTYCSYGNSTYFTVNMIDDVTTWIKAVSGVLAAIGPLTLIGFFVVENKLKKKA